jgi:hypothetical protein
VTLLAEIRPDESITSPRSPRSCFVRRTNIQLTPRGSNDPSLEAVRMSGMNAVLQASSSRCSAPLPASRRTLRSTRAHLTGRWVSATGSRRTPRSVWDVQVNGILFNHESPPRRNLRHAQNRGQSRRLSGQAGPSLHETSMLSATGDTQPNTSSMWRRVKLMNRTTSCSQRAATTRFVTSLGSPSSTPA